ncbi:cysteine-rich receptor-like protein kinase 6 [Panicum virgatum]|uniref:cysteine-rich receptor-like protein kinase 6 n=1 Tax=Panicum virgatum TaxID=38727 RepID=UPI0019D5E7E5|nr:cysteine-rich receptor-like protein kinase 6 [Panicum virgatum]
MGSRSAAGTSNASACAVCVAASFGDAERACPMDTAAVYRDACVLRFTSFRFLDFLREDQWLASELNAVIYADPGSVTNAPAAWFSAALTGIFSALVNRAVAAAPSNSTRKYFATAEMDFDPKLYGLAQCAPDLTPAQCRDCLGNLVAVVTTQFLKRRAPGTSAFVVWCSLRYSGVSPVFEGWAMLQLTAPPEPPPEATLAPPASESGAGTKRSRAGISAGISCSVVLMLILSVFFFIRFRRRIKAGTE